MIVYNRATAHRYAPLEGHYFDVIKSLADKAESQLQSKPDAAKPARGKETKSLYRVKYRIMLEQSIRVATVNATDAANAWRIVVSEHSYKGEIVNVLLDLTELSDDAQMPMEVN